MFFFNDTATTEIYTLSLHDALPILRDGEDLTPYVLHAQVHLPVLIAEDPQARDLLGEPVRLCLPISPGDADEEEQALARSEEHTSELQSRQYLVCRLLLEKKKKHH